MMELRDYQRAAVEAVYGHLRERDDNPLVVIPTGGGKTPVIASICRDAVTLWQGRVLVLAHVKELLEQAVGRLDAMAPGLGVGVYSAGLRRRELEHPVTVAGIQSIWQRAGELGPVDLVIVDEAHLIPPGDGEGRYREFLDDARLVNPHIRVIGLTATPFRMRTGMICSPGGILNKVCFEVGVGELIERGFLSPLRTRAGRFKVDTSGLKVRDGEFVASEVERAFDTDEVVERACAEIASETRERRSTLIFAAGIDHGRHVVSTLRHRHGIECGWIDGTTSARDRERTIGRFRSGELRHLANVNVLTTGFDAPNIDCVVMLRPTASPGLYYQMVGRGFRLCPGKQDCLVLDFGGNVMRHGPVDDLRLGDRNPTGREAPMKECASCNALVPTASRECPECGHAFPEPERERHDPTATTEAVLRSRGPRRSTPVLEVRYFVHRKLSDPEAPPSMRVEYRTGLGTFQREWVCLAHPEGSFARRKAEEWWRLRSDMPLPGSVEDAVWLASQGALAACTGIGVTRKPGERYDRISSHELGPIPAWNDTASQIRTITEVPDDGIPI
jgi:DNA repair protein RadD